ncbi:MAG: glycoside hydrolase family 16 protein, partial [Ruminococcus sp.]|nr:glycoside hydrolase family 16 protein [Ruminococcus sp.]
MKTKKKLITALAVGTALSAVPFCSDAFSSIEMDYNNDGIVDVFDMIAARKKPASKAELERLSSFLHGKKVEIPDSGYSLVWSDEFDGNEVDMTKWSYELGNWKLDENGNYITGGWGNNEQEFYTDKNAAVSDGVLTIAARKENYTDEVQGSYEYTSSRLSTQHKFSTCGGRIEVRARCDSGKSLWPAIWMLPEDSVYGGWA